MMKEIVDHIIWYDFTELFIGRDNFKEVEDGMYKKTLEIENMVKLIPNDMKSLSSVSMMEMRTRFQGGNSKLYTIWLPKYLESEVSGKGTGNYPSDLEPWLVDLINKHKIENNKASQEAKDIHKKIVSQVIGKNKAKKRYNM